MADQLTSAAESKVAWSRSRTRVYFEHILALFFPSKRPLNQQLDKNEPGDLEGWTENDLQLLVDEGRRQLDAQQADLEKIRTRAQFIATVGIALGALICGFLTKVSNSGSVGPWIFWGLSLLLVGMSVLGSAATAAVRWDGDTIHATVLSTRKPHVLRGLAEDYAAIAPTGESQNLNRLINMRIAILLLLIGGFAALVSWVWATSLDPSSTTHLHEAARWAPLPHAIWPQPQGLHPPFGTRPFGCWHPHGSRLHDGSIFGGGCQ